MKTKQIIALIFVVVLLLVIKLWMDSDIDEDDDGEPYELNELCNTEPMAFPSYFHLKLLKKGKPFDCELLSLLKKFELLNDKFDSMPELRNSKVVFITYANSESFLDVLGTIESIRKFTSNNAIVLYDIGLTDDQVFKIPKKYHVLYQRFDFENYPKHVKNTENFAFRPIIVAESYRYHDAFFVLDPIMRLTHAQLLKRFYKHVRERTIDPYVTGLSTLHPMLEKTSPSTFKYLPLSDEFNQNHHRDATIQFVLRSLMARETIKWSLLCALTVSCVSADISLADCDKSTTTKCRLTDPAKDAAILSIILVNLRARDDRKQMWEHKVDYLSTFSRRRDTKPKNGNTQNF